MKNTIIEETMFPAEAWFLTDRQNRSAQFSRRCLEIMGLKKTEAAGEGWLQAVHPDDRERLGMSANLRFRKPNGAIAWVDLIKLVTKDGYLWLMWEASAPAACVLL